MTPSNVPIKNPGEIHESILNKSNSLKRSSSLFDNLKNLVGQSDANIPAPAADACPQVMESISHTTQGDWIVVSSQDGKLQVLPTQPSYEKQPLTIDWRKDRTLDSQEGPMERVKVFCVASPSQIIGSKF